MAPIWTDEFTFTTGSVHSKDITYLVASNDDLSERQISHSVFIVWVKGKWHALENPVLWICPSVCICKHPDGRAVGIGEWGDVLVLNHDGKNHTETISDKGDLLASRGPLRRVRSIAGVAYAVGTDRQVYRRKSVNFWESMGGDVKPSSDDIFSFESIDGFSESDIYAVGIQGEIWHYNGSLWNQISSPTNFALNDLCCAPDGKVYVCGRNGIVLLGRDDMWQVVEHDRTGDAFWSVTWYRDAVYLSTLRMVYRLRERILEPVAFGNDKPRTCYHLSTADGVLWSIGGKDLMALDGNTWTRVD